MQNLNCHLAFPTFEGVTELNQNGEALLNVRLVSKSFRGLTLSSLPLQKASALPVPLVMLCLGFLAIFLPTYITLDGHVWNKDGQGHGPILLALIGWLAWQRWPAFRDLDAARARGAALVCGVIGAGAYLLGRTQDLMFLDTLAQPILLAGLALWFRGWRGLKTMAFPLFFFLFVIPIPTSIVDSLTAPLKMAVSVVSEEILAFFGYPVAREGVKLVIGPYWLLVADACAGMNSIFALEAVGVFYLSLIPDVRRARQLLLAFLILPISFISNVTRVCALVLVTYYLGDEVGQGFLHNFAGVFLFVVATVLTVGTDTLLAQIFPGRRESAENRTPSHQGAKVLAVPLSVAGTIAAVGLALCYLGYGLQPKFRDDVISQAEFEALFPTQFGEWREVKSSVAQVRTIVAQGALSQQQPYDAEILRTYMNAQGEQVMLAIAYGANQRQEIKVHRPEVCYPAAGRKILSLGPATFPIQTHDGRSVDGFQMLATDSRQQFYEPVSYWIRLGDTFTANGMKQRLHILQRGLHGERTDGVLVRFSQIVRTEDAVGHSREVQMAFAKALLDALSPKARQLLVDGSS